MRGVAIRFLLLIKRNLMNKLYLLLLIAIPFLAVFIYGVSADESGLYRVVLVDEDKSDISSKVVEDFLELRTHIGFTVCDDKNEGLSLISEAKADSLWVLSESFSDAIAAFGRDGYLSYEAPIEVYNAAETVFDKLSRVRAFSVIYPYIVRSFYLSEVSDYNYSTNELNAIYEKYKITERLFENSQANIANVSIGLSPVNGILAILIFVFSLMGMVSFYSDLESGILNNISMESRGRLSYIYVVAFVLPLALSVELARVLLGMNSVFAFESIAFCLLIISSVAAGRLLGCVLASAKMITYSIPVLFLLMLGLNPVYINLRQLRMVQLILPTYHYLTAGESALSMMAFAAIALLYIVVNKVVFIKK